LNLSQNSSRGNEELSSGLIHKTAINYLAAALLMTTKNLWQYKEVVSDIVK
jgi:hypothetical protein